MKQIVQRGTAQARPELGHAVHVDVRGLEPAPPYFYRFNAGSHATAIGRTRTAPAAGVMADKLRFAFASCQHWEQGYFTALRPHGPRRPRSRRPSRRLHLRSTARGRTPCARINGPEIMTLDDYRNRYALYRSDPICSAPRTRRSRSSSPGTITRSTTTTPTIAPKTTQPRDAFLTRRAHAYQAYFEHMPLRAAARPKAAGDAALSPPRLRSARGFPRARYAPVPHRSAVRQDRARRSATARSIRKRHHPRRRAGALDDGRARQVAVTLERPRAAGAAGGSRFRRRPGPSVTRWTSGTRIRPTARRVAQVPRGTQAIQPDRAHRRHPHQLGERSQADYRDAESATIGTEFVGTSISSGGDGQAMTAARRRRSCPTTRTSASTTRSAATSPAR